MSFSTKNFWFFSEFLCSISSSHHVDHSVSCVLLIDKPNESCQKFQGNAISTTKKKKLLKRKRNSITSAKTNAPISQTSSERLKLTIQTYQMRNKKLKNEAWTTLRGNIKASLPVSADLNNEFTSAILEIDLRKVYPSSGSFWRSSKNIYNALSIMVLITPWTRMLMLHIRQLIYLVLANVLSTSFLMFHITFDEISTTLSVQF